MMPEDCVTAQLKSLSEDDLAHYWRLYVDKLAALLAEADARPHGPAPDLARRVQSLQREALFLHIRQASFCCIAKMDCGVHTSQNI